MFERRSEPVAASEKLEEGPIVQQQPLGGHRINLLLERRILVAQCIDGSACLQRCDQAAAEGDSKDKGDGCNGKEREAVAQSRSGR